MKYRYINIDTVIQLYRYRLEIDMDIDIDIHVGCDCMMYACMYVCVCVKYWFIYLQNSFCTYLLDSLLTLFMLLDLFYLVS